MLSLGHQKWCRIVQNSSIQDSLFQHCANGFKIPSIFLVTFLLKTSKVKEVCLLEDFPPFYYYKTLRFVFSSSLRQIVNSGNPTSRVCSDKNWTFWIRLVLFQSPNKKLIRYIHTRVETVLFDFLCDVLIYLTI